MKGSIVVTSVGVEVMGAGGDGGGGRRSWC